MREISVVRLIVPLGVWMTDTIPGSGIIKSVVFVALMSKAAY